MICPQCRAEFVQGVELCADCEVPLVPATPEPDPRFRSPLEADERWTVLLQSQHLIEADQAAAALEEVGIPHHLAESEPAELALELPLPAAFGPGTWWAIHVPEARLQEARSVLESQPAAPEEPAAPEQPVEERRHEPGAAAKRQLKGLVLAYLVLLGFLFVWGLVSLFELLFP